MKLVFALIICVTLGWASGATILHNELDQDTNELVEEVSIGLLQEVFSSEDKLRGYGYSDEITKTENDDVKEKLAETLRETLDKVLQKIWDAIEHGRQVSKDLTDKAKEISDKLKELGLESGNKAQELLKRIKSRASEWLKRILEKLGGGKKMESFLYGNTIPIQFQADYLSRDLEETLTEPYEIEITKEYFEHILGSSNQDDVGYLESLEVDALNNLISITQEELMEFFFSNLDNVFLIAQYKPEILDFAAWVREIFEAGFEHAQHRIENLRAVTSEIAKKTELEYEEATFEVLTGGAGVCLLNDTDRES